MNGAFLVGATGVEEVVVVPFQLTDWRLWNVSSKAILYGDPESIF